jgi:hypothetical protein
MFKAFALAAGLALTGIAAAPITAAQTPGGPNTGVEQVYYTVSPQDVAALLNRRGLVTQVMEGGPNPVVRAFQSQADMDANKLHFFVRMTACNLPTQPAGCLGLQFGSIKPLSSPDEIARARRVADTFHAQESFGRAYVVGDEFIVMDFYVITDYGVTMKHLEGCALEYNALVRRFEEKWASTP